MCNLSHIDAISFDGDMNFVEFRKVMLSFLEYALTELLTRVPEK